MKKTYTKPFAEKIEFDYSSQVVAKSTGCIYVWIDNKDSTGTCDEQSKYSKLNND